MYKTLFIILFSSTLLAQKSEDFSKYLKTESQKNNFSNYNSKVNEIKDFIVQNSKFEIEKDSVIEVSNTSNIDFYNGIKALFSDLNKVQNDFYLSFDYNKDKKILEKLNQYFSETKSKINDAYLKRNWYLKVSIDRISSPNSVDALPSEVCERYTENSDILLPTHQNCKDKGLSGFEENKCFENFLRERFSNVIRDYISDLYLENTLSLSVMITFIIDKEGRLDFIRFPRSTGSLYYDLLIYKAFQRIQKTTIFCPARKDNTSVSIYYNLPIKMVITGEY